MSDAPLRPHEPLTTDNSPASEITQIQVRASILNNAMTTEIDTVTTSTNRVAVYLRVSTDDQNVLSQSAFVDNLIRQHGFDPSNVLEFKDEGVSATKMGNLRDRPDGKELVEAIERGEVTHLFAFRVDRMFRDLEAGAAFIKWVREKQPQLNVFTTDAPMSLTTADGEFLFGMQVLLARREAAVLSVRVGGGMDATREALKPTSHAVFGWDICHTSNGEKTLRPNWKQQAVLEWIEAQHKTGLSNPKIAKQLNAWGVQTATGKQWVASGVRRMIVSPAKYQQELHQFKRPKRMTSAPFRSLSLTQK